MFVLVRVLTGILHATEDISNLCIQVCVSVTPRSTPARHTPKPLQIARNGMSIYKSVVVHHAFRWSILCKIHTMFGSQFVFYLPFVDLVTRTYNYLKLPPEQVHNGELSSSQQSQNIILACLKNLNMCKYIYIYFLLSSELDCSPGSGRRHQFREPDQTDVGNCSD